MESYNDIHVEAPDRDKMFAHALEFYCYELNALLCFGRPDLTHALKCYGRVALLWETRSNPPVACYVERSQAGKVVEGAHQGQYVRVSQRHVRQSESAPAGLTEKP